MAEYANPFSENTNDSGFGENVRDDGPTTAPASPLVGSALYALVSRQSLTAGSDRRLGFVPAQIR